MYAGIAALWFTLTLVLGLLASATFPRDSTGSSDEYDTDRDVKVGDGGLHGDSGDGHDGDEELSNRFADVQVLDDNADTSTIYNK